MKHQFDLDRIHDIPDPLEGLDRVSLPPRLVAPSAPPPTRSRVALERTVALGAALVYELAWAAILNRRHDINEVPPGTLFIELTIPIAAAALALAAASSPGKGGLGEGRRWLVTLALLAPLLFAVATILLGPPDVDTEGFWPHALRCLVMTGLFAAGPVAVAVRAFRHAFVVAPAWRAAALWMACAALGASTAAFVCSVGSPSHVLVGHGGMILVGALLGATIGRRLTTA